MNEVARIHRGEIAEFKPQEAKKRDAKADALIEYAIKVKDPVLLEQTVDAKIADQAELVRSWRDRVRKSGQPEKVSAQIGANTFLSVPDAEELTGIRHQQVSKWAKSLEDKEKYRLKLITKGLRAMGLEPEENHRAEGTGENEWYTPAKYIELARSVLGEIDLDPASSVKAQETVRAATYFSAAQNGLHQEWTGRVWLNPPYAQPLIGQFIEKLCDELCAGRATSAILLTHNYTDTAWFHKACEIADAICFTRGRIKFLDSEGGDCAPTQGQAFFYFGEEAEKFAAVFLDVGFVVSPAGDK